jgi:hypothetical protein
MKVITALVLLALCGSAMAWPEPMKKPKDPQQRQMQTQEATANSESVSAATAHGGDAGDNSLVNVSEHTFYSYAQSDRGAVNCFISGDGAAASDGKFGAFGIYWLDTNCWMDAVAANERDVEINALLKCGGKKYRNAIAYDQPKRERQRFCVDKLMDSGMAQIREENARLVAEVERARKETEICEEGIERCTEAFIEKQSK